MKALISSGATREPIDGVRFITNMSTGATGAALADYFGRRGDRVTYLHGMGADCPRSSCRRIEFTSFADLHGKLRALLRREDFDLIIHCAAVSDYSVAGRRPAKLDSRRDLTLRLRRNFKILDRLPRYARNRPLIVGFKLTNTKDEAARRRAAARLRCGLVVHNDVHDMNGGRVRRYRIFGAGAETTACSSREELARRLWRLTHASRA